MPDVTQRLLDTASVWASAQAAALPDHARWAVTRRLDLTGFDACVAVDLRSGIVRLFVAGPDGPEAQVAMPAEAAE